MKAALLLAGLLALGLVAAAPVQAAPAADADIDASSSCNGVVVGDEFTGVCGDTCNGSIYVAGRLMGQYHC